MTQPTRETTDHIYVVLDTNILLHGPRFDQVNWPKIMGATKITLLISAVVLNELDRYKYDTRTASRQERAQDVIRLLAALLERDLTSLTADLTAQTTVRVLQPPDLQHLSALGLQSAGGDDQLIASCHAFTSEQPGSHVVLISRDLGLRLRARAYGLNASVPPEGLAIAGPSVMEKLERQVERYRDRVPKLNLTFDEHHHRVLDDHRTAVLAVPKQQPDWLVVLSEVEDEMQRLTLEFGREREEAPTNTPQHELDLFDELAQMYLREHRRHLINSRLIEHGTEYSLELRLSNDGNVSATDVRADIDFPDSCIVVEEDDRESYGRAPIPIRPQPSWRRRPEPYESPSMASFYSSPLTASTPYRPPATYRGPLYSIDDDGTFIGDSVPRTTYNDVQFEADKLRHGEPWKLPRLIIIVAPTEASALHASVTLHCDEYPAPDEQQLVFVLGGVE